MNRTLRVFPLLTGLALATVLGAAACQKVPLLAPTGSVINLMVSSDTAALNSSIDVTAVIIENGQQSSGTGTGSTGTSVTGAGTPVHDGTLVSFTTTIGTIEPADARTSNGRVTVKLTTGGTSGKATITAYSGGAKATIPLSIGAFNVNTVTLSANPQNLPSVGGKSTLTAFVQDVSGNGLPGIPVVFATSKGTLSPETATTDSSGLATSTLLTTQAASVTATAGAKTSTALSITLSSRATITVTASPTTAVVSQPMTFTITPGTGTLLANMVIDYGDGSNRSLGASSGAQTTVHLFNSSGIFNVTASGTDPDGVAATATTQVAITSVSGTLTASPATVARGSLITFTATPTTGASIDHYSWDFGDNTSAKSVGGTQSHVYDPAISAGVKTVTVTVHTVSGYSFDIVLQISVT